MKLRRHFSCLLSPLLFLALAGCSMSLPSMPSLWPFGDGEVKENSRKPANATEYRCDGGRAFFVRTIEGGAVWLMAPDRDIRLDKRADGSFGAGKVTLELSGDTATLTDPPTPFTNCKRGT